MKIFFGIISFVVILNADMFEPSHSCYKPTKPYKPYSFSSQWEVDNYNNEIESFADEVDTYKRCINNFVKEQNDAISAHGNAADSAVNDWNNFVNYELN